MADNIVDDHEIMPSDGVDPMLDDKVSMTMRFTNRRRMAWIALWSIILVTGVMLFVPSPERILALQNTITWFYITMGSIIGSYLGSTTWAYIATQKFKAPS